MQRNVPMNEQEGITGAEEFGGQYVPADTPPVIAETVVPGHAFASGDYDAGRQVPEGGGDTDNPGETPPEVVPDQGDTDVPGAPDEVFPDDGDLINPGSTPDETQPLPNIVTPPD